MKAILYRTGAVVAVCLMLSILAASTAEATVLKNKQTGEIIKGTLTEQKINNKVVFKLDSGASKFIVPEEWEVVETDEPGPADQDGGESTDDAGKTTDATGDAGEEKKQRVRAYMIPIKGAIMSKALVRGIDKALDEAKKKRCTLIVFQMDTGGGRVDVASGVIDRITAIDWAKTVAWVSGEEKQALSAGAFISLATEAIYMAPDTTIGAAVPFHGTTSGSVEVDEKFQSAFRAKFRALAQKRGHPVAIADAMVDSSVAAVQVFVDGVQQVVTEDEARLLKQEHGEKYKRGKTICERGKILTLTADEALEYGVAKAKAGNEKDLMQTMEISDYTVSEARWIPDWVTKTAETEKQRFEKARNVFNSNFEQAMMSDPTRVMYPDQRGTAPWTRMTKQCMGYLKNCALALKEIEKIANDPDADRHVSPDEVNEWKSRLQAMYQRLGASLER